LPPAKLAALAAWERRVREIAALEVDPGQDVGFGQQIGTAQHAGAGCLVLCVRKSSVYARAGLYPNFCPGGNQLFYRFRHQRYPGFPCLFLPWDRNSHMSVSSLNTKLGMVHRNCCEKHYS
jgi:hypothetical protein